MEKKENNTHPSCASCDTPIFSRICIDKEGKPSKGCPTLTRKNVLLNANKEFNNDYFFEFARQASIQEAEGYANREQIPYTMQPSKTRIVEIIEFSKKMNFKVLGVAFCIGLANEARVVESIFKKNGFDVVSVVCKAGRTSKTDIGIEEQEKIFMGMDEPMCNPIYQAMLLNHEKVDFNVLVGLCVGHDSMFFKYAEAPTTVLAVKDRVTGHNPLAAIYLVDSYYQKIKNPVD